MTEKPPHKEKTIWTRRFPFLGYELEPFANLVAMLNGPSDLGHHVSRTRFSVRLLRYWWAGQRLKREAERQGRPLVVVDLGCERGWLKHFTPHGAVCRWIGLDWQVREEARTTASYDVLKQSNFDEVLPLESHCADAVVSLHVFEHLPRPGATMSEVSRILRPGGIFLGAAPTMPAWLGRLRERYLRSQLRKGRVTEGGHITVLSPARWKSLSRDCGLQVEFATGSHFLRMTGNRIENQRWWIRLNQIWGAMAPSLGSECCVQARRDAGWAKSAKPIAPMDSHWRKLWIALGLTAVAALVMLGVHMSAKFKKWNRLAVSAWIDAHQTGQDRFVVAAPELDLCRHRSDTNCASDFADLLRLVGQHPGARLLVPLGTAILLSQASPANDGWRIASRLEIRGQDYLMLSRAATGTLLVDYLRGSTTAAWPAQPGLATAAPRTP